MTHCEACNGTGKRVFRTFDGSLCPNTGFENCPVCGGRGEISEIKQGQESHIGYQMLLESEKGRIKK